MYTRLTIVYMVCILCECSRCPGNSVKLLFPSTVCSGGFCRTMKPFQPSQWLPRYVNTFQWWVTGCHDDSAHSYTVYIIMYIFMSFHFEMQLPSKWNKSFEWKNIWMLNISCNSILIFQLERTNSSGRQPPSPPYLHMQAISSLRELRPLFESLHTGQHSRTDALHSNSESDFSARNFSSRLTAVENTILEDFLEPF